MWFDPPAAHAYARPRHSRCASRRKEASMTASSHDLTTMLRQWSAGDAEALDQLMPVVYDQLRRQAALYFRRERAGNTLQTTALVHEVYLRLIDQKRVQWQNRAHFFAIAARLMRRVLVDHARSHL